MKKFNNKSGFTLIEIIVVMIIVGILAAIALPNLFQNVAKSHGVQALTLLDSYKTPVEAYYQSKLVAPSGNVTADIVSAGLSTATQGGWTITEGTGPVNATGTAGAILSPQGTAEGSNLQYTLIATDGGNNTITLSRATSGTWTCSTGTASSYTGLC